MKCRYSGLLFVLLACMVSKATNVSLDGTVTDQSGSAVKAALVRLLSEGVETQTDASGHYSIEQLATQLKQRQHLTPSMVTLVGIRLLVSVEAPTRISVELFDTRGRSATGVVDQLFPAGRHSLSFLDADISAGVTLVRVRLGASSHTFKCLPLGQNTGGRQVWNTSGFTSLRKALAAVDTLRVTKTGYSTKNVPLESYDGTVDVVLAASRIPSFEQVLAQPGQISDNDLHKADCNYLSTEVPEASRTAWNAYYKEWITDKAWDQGIPTFPVGVNSQTRIKMRNWSQFPTIDSDGVLNFNHLTRWLAESGDPRRNYKHVRIKLYMKDMSSNYLVGTDSVNYLKPGVDYESGFTWWEGGTPNWIREHTTGGTIAIWQIHGTDAVAMYVQVTGYGTMNINGFVLESPGASSQSIPSYKLPDQSHEGIHVMKLQYHVGSNGYLRMFHNGTKIYDSGTKNFSGFSGYYEDFMNYSAYKDSTVEQIVYMDRLYHRAL